MARKKSKKHPDAYTMTVDVELSLEDWKQRSQELAGIQAQLAEIDQELQDAKEAAKEAKAAHGPRLSELWRILQTGKEPRELEVVDKRDLAQGVVNTIAVESGAVLATRPMDEEERQADLVDDGYTQ